MTGVFRAKYERVIRVGGPEADIGGFNSGALQIAADALKTCGGGVIELSEGIFEMTGPVRLYSNIHLKGQGRATVLKKAHGISSSFAEDVDYGVYSARIADTRGFKVGTGILIRDSVNAVDWSTSTSKIIAVKGDTIYFDRHTVMNYIKDKNGMVTNACPVIEAVKADNVKISGISIDGSKETNFPTDSCRGAGVYMHKVSGCTVEDIVLYDWNGDGISWQKTEDITVRGNKVYGCTGFGLHPGTGSERTLVENCHIHDNGLDGMYVCWMVRNGIFRNNDFSNNSGSGISIGHKDTDNIFEQNRICNNGEAGITVRAETEANNADRNLYRNNFIEDNGNGEPGYGFFFESPVKENVIEKNVIRDTGRGRQSIGIYYNGDTIRLKLADNTMSGHVSGDISRGGFIR